MRVAVLGYGVEGRSAARYWRDMGAEITVCDSSEELDLPVDVQSQLGENYLEGLDQFDLIVRSPGVLPSQFETSTPVTTVMDEFLRVCPAPVIGVTGSKGKGTTATLIHKMLEATGRTAWLGGNIGLPPLEFLAQVSPSDYVVLEMSNLQLWDITSSPQIAVLLAITPDHLDWHEGKMSAYVATKANITRFQRSEDKLFYRADNPYTEEIAATTAAQALAFMNPASAWVDGEEVKYQDTHICAVSEVQLVGRHNLDNICAALAAVWQVAPDPTALRSAIREYKGLEHRLEFVHRISKVDYYNDSIGTTPEAAMAAIRAFKQPKVLIMGGSSKGVDFKELAVELTAQSVRGVVLIGETATELAATLERAGYQGELEQLEDSETIIKEAVDIAAKLAQPGDVVLLAPACASFGLFKNYQERGKQFKAAVEKLTHS
ncbi:MAG: UDP-N-acetylmuramoyl-L-alanine--D-glutamate ligase [Candidatus Saccharimonadales bacterium]